MIRVVYCLVVCARIWVIRLHSDQYIPAIVSFRYLFNIDRPTNFRNVSKRIEIDQSDRGCLPWWIWDLWLYLYRFCSEYRVLQIHCSLHILVQCIPDHTDIRRNVNLASLRETYPVGCSKVSQHHSFLGFTGDFAGSKRTQYIHKRSAVKTAEVSDVRFSIGKGLYLCYSISFASVAIHHIYYISLLRNLLRPYLLVVLF